MPWSGPSFNAANGDPPHLPFGLLYGCRYGRSHHAEVGNGKAQLCGRSAKILPLDWNIPDMS